MPPGTEQAISSAMATNRYEAVALVVIMLTVTGFLVYVVSRIMDQALKREEKLGVRIDNLESFIRTELMGVVRENTKAMLNISVEAGENTLVLVKLIESMHTTRVCFATSEHQEKLVDVIAHKVAERTHSLLRDKI